MNPEYTNSSSASSVISSGALKMQEEMGSEPSKESKLKAFFSILRKFVGVKDIANVRFSLPAQLLEPISNLDYWNYLDRPDAFVSIGQQNDALLRMLEVLRFWFTKDLKFIKGRPCKPYNSTLGEMFRCHWDVDAPMADIEGSTDTTSQHCRVAFITEQTSHHPPISAFYAECRERGIVAYGMDQLSASFTGTSIKVMPGESNHGIFIKLRGRGDEEYRLTHPNAFLGGFLRGSIHVSIQGTTYVTCKQTDIVAVMEYFEDGWFSKTKNRVKGVIYSSRDLGGELFNVNNVPPGRILATFGGCWREDLVYQIAGAASKTLISIPPLEVYPKIRVPLEKQMAHESGILWQPVTEAIHYGQLSQATKRKTEIEETQRELATRRKEREETWTPRYFKTPVLEGRPKLTNSGLDIINSLFENNPSSSNPTTS